MIEQFIIICLHFYLGHFVYRSLKRAIFTNIYVPFSWSSHRHCHLQWGKKPIRTFKSRALLWEDRVISVLCGAFGNRWHELIFAYPLAWRWQGADLLTWFRPSSSSSSSPSWDEYTQKIRAFCRGFSFQAAAVAPKCTCFSQFIDWVLSAIRSQTNRHRMGDETNRVISIHTKWNLSALISHHHFVNWGQRRSS